MIDDKFKLTFANGQTADVINLPDQGDLTTAFSQLGIDFPRPVLVLVGGAAGIEAADMQRLRSLFVEVITPMVESLGAAVVDGGTDSGVMQLIGQARAQTGALFPLIGVAPVGKVAIGGEQEGTALEPNHTHFLLIPGNKWGQESPYIARIASLLSQGLSSLTLVVNGGEITWEDARYSVEEGRRIIAVAGSGRTADKIAAALSGNFTDQRAQNLIEFGQVEAIHLIQGPDVLGKLIADSLTSNCSSQLPQESADTRQNLLINETTAKQILIDP